MAWTCRLVAEPELASTGYADLARRAIGDMWFLEAAAGDLSGLHLSDFYFAKNAGRRPLVIALPCAYYDGPGKTRTGPIRFLVDGKCYSHKKGYYDGWEVSGSPPIITMKPSINYEGIYHGHLKAGVLTDDCEGRKYL